MSYYCPNCGQKNRVSYNFCYKCGKRLKYLHLEEFKQKPKETPKEFEVNKYIKLKLEKDKTIIYVNNKKFTQCKYLLIEIPTERIEEFDEIISIDEASEKLDHSLEDTRQERIIPADIEFWGHCSNLQAWAEHNYDTRLLHSNLAFPLLKKLADIGDPTAKRVFKEEIAKRIESGERNVINYLILENYLEYFNHEEYSLVITNLKEQAVEQFKKKYERHLNSLDLTTLLDLIKENAENPKLLALAPMKLINRDTIVGFTIQDDRVTRLNLIKCGLINLPDSIGYLQNLIDMNLLGNKIKHIPDSLGQLENLKLLNLNYNRIETLPQTLESLKYIEEITLEHNQVKDLPKSITKLKKLRYLTLWENRLSELPENIGNLENLSVLNLSHNSIQSLPDSINKLKSLRTLDVSNNILRKLPEDLENLQSLQNLWLNNNRIRDLPEAIVFLKSLKNIYLSGNPLHQYIFSNRIDVLNKLKSNGVNIW